MFTGIVEEMGRVAAITTQVPAELTITCRTALEGTSIGDSIAVNGVCLTVTQLSDSSVTFGVSPETLRRTSLGDLRPGAPVNLERAVALGGRMGGHYVQGHIDDVGEITAIRPEGESLRITVRPPARLMPFIVEKGFIAIDGVSLTVADLGSEDFTVVLIAHTQQAVVMGGQDVGARVNLEVDILAKYVARLVQPYTSVGKELGDVQPA